MDLAERHALTENKVYYDAPLIESFKRYLKTVRPESKANLETAFYPMLHLENNGFWRLQHQPGKENELNKFRNGSAKRSNKFIRENVAYAKLDNDLYCLLLDAHARTKLKKILINARLESDQNDSRNKIQRMQQEAEYEYKLINAMLDGVRCAREDIPPKAIRKPVFRRLVLSAYGYKCAATGWNFSLPNNTSLLEAAHILPFSESYDDRTMNGMALTPNIHRAMDRQLIAPSPDRKWHVSKYLSRGDNNFQWLYELNGRKIRTAENDLDKPNIEALEWRFQQFQEQERKRK